MKFIKPCRRDIKILLALQQNIHTYAGNLIYGVRIQVNVGDRMAKKILQCVAATFWKKLKKMNFVSDGHFEADSMSFNFSLMSIKSNYDDMFSFLYKLKFDDSNI